MQTKMKKYSILASLIAILALVAIAISSLIVTTIDQIGKETIAKLQNNKTTIIAEMKIQNNDGSAEITEFTNTGLAINPGKELYCVNHGVAFHKDGETLRIDTAKYYGNLDGSIKTWPRTHASCRFAGDTNIGKITYPYLECIGNHYDLLDPQGEYHPDLAYILTYPVLGKWDEVKQNAVWATEFARARGKSTDISQEGKLLYQEAMHFKQFSEKTTSVETADVRSPYIAPEDYTKVDTLKIMPNYNEQTITIGAFSIDYISGIYEDATFGGISDMYFIGYNAKGQVVKDRIEIEKYIAKNKEYDLSFFTPNQKDNSYVDYRKQVYPKGRSAGEREFYLKIANPNEGIQEADQTVTNVKLHIDFKWLGVTAANICEMDAHKYQVMGKDSHSVHCHGHSNGNGGTYRCSGCCYYCTWSTWLKEIDIQDHINILEGQRKLFFTSFEIPNTGDNININIAMELGGHVWEDTKSGKETKADGRYDTQGDNIDIPLQNVKVTLYSCEKDAKIGEGTKVELPMPDDIEEDEIMGYVNPTLTDENGNYLFKKLDSLKKYYVTFEYNGQIYLPTEYLNTGDEQYSSVKQMVNAGLYNTLEWEVTSKATENANDRENYNEQFEEIGSNPKNYQVTNTIYNRAALYKDGRNYYNVTFTQKELMGYTLDENGYYYKTQEQLVDGFLYDENGIETTRFAQGLISKKIRQYIEENREFPDENAMQDIYQEIAGNNKTLWRKIQFIQDCKIISYTMAQDSRRLDTYPVYDNFVFYSDLEQEKNGLNISEPIEIAEDLYSPIYPGQYYINQGLWRREKNDVALRKDVYRAATKINGKTEIYEYDKRADGEDYWQINVRMQDYHNYYAANYNRELYLSDYHYKAANTNLYGQELELYVTYKITIRNASQGILNEITEVVDYYDKDYTYMPNLSWVMYKDTAGANNEKVKVTQTSYYNMMHNLDLSKMPNAREVESSYATKTDSNGNYCGSSIYGDMTKQDLEQEFNSVYVNGLQGKKLATGESTYIYLTFKVNKDSKGPVILDEDGSLKENYAEINGYKNYYADKTELPNGIIIKGDTQAPGIIDINSTPGNLELSDLQGEKYEKNFENDTDRAISIKILLDNEARRALNGNVWEDERNCKIADSMIGDGVRQEGEIGVEGVTVELVEKLENGSEYVWQSTVSGSGTGIQTDIKTGDTKKYTYNVKNAGYYEFTDFIPGNYIVRFSYGNGKETVLTANNGGKNAVSYNGQDFKSTVYAQNLNKNQSAANYTDPYYNISASDRLSIVENGNVSDAKDLWETKTATVGNTQNNKTNYQTKSYQGRTNVNNYSTSNVNNYLAKILAAPYASKIDENQINELIKNTNMVAETAIIVTQVEYNRTSTDGNNTASNGNTLYLYGNDENGKHTYNNVDFGLTERPKAGLELDQNVANVKITLANGNILFDAEQSVNNLVWIKGQAYNLNSQMKNGKYPEYYQESKNNHNYNRYSYRAEVDKLVNSLYGNNKRNGLIQATMDEEIMHGATITISYNLVVKNIGETDYQGTDFYYKAAGATEENKVTTAANLVIDYVANNLQYREKDNQNWKIVTAADLTNNDANKVGERLVENNLEQSLNQFNTILQTSNLNANLKPGETTKQGLILSQLITSQNKQDDKTYNNIAEIVQTSNTVGRRMAYSIVGNQDPLKAPSEIDASKAEEVVILPPFGKAYLFVGIGAVTAMLIAGGIIFIKKKIMK